MTLSRATTQTAPAGRIQRASVSDEFRLRALERLYQRKAVMDELIDSLENYQRCQAMAEYRRLFKAS